MATNFPGSQDSFTNPTSSDTLDSPDHAAQHSNVNDAVEAIELALLDGAPLHIDDVNERVGIGTTSPTESLTVAGDARIGTSTQYVLVDYDDNQKLEIVENNATGRPYLAIFNQDASGNLDRKGYFGYPENASDSSNINVVSDQGDLRLIASGTEGIRVAAGGKVGIGTTSPVDLFDVGDGTTAGSFRVHATRGGESFRVVGTVVRSANIVNLTTASAANVFISTANNSMYRSTSSAKYKTDIETLEDEYADIVFELRPVWYRSTTGNDPEEYSYYGLIAEEVAQVDPRLVHFGATADCGCVEDEDGHIEHEQACLTEPEGVFYERLVPHLINVVQRQQTQIDALTARIEALEA